MATLPTLSLPIKIIGLSKVKSDLKALKDSIQKSTDGIAKTQVDKLNQSFRLTDQQVHQLGTSLSSIGRVITQVGNSFGAVGKTITAAFAGAFALARKDIPKVDRTLKDFKNSFIAIADSVAETTLPVLQSLGKIIIGVSNAIGKLSEGFLPS